MKVKLFAWWIDTPRLTERFKRQFIGSYFNTDEITLTTSEDYDVAVVFGFTKENIKTDKNNTIVFFQEPYWSHNWDREAYKYSNYVFCPDKKLYGNYDEFIEHPTYMFYGGHGDEYFDIDTILNYSNTNKSKNSSFIVTYRSYSPLTGCNTHSIYDKRVNLAEECIKRDMDVDIYGGLWEYSPYKKSNITPNVYTKYIGVDPYRFSIAIENTSISNYITEKFFDPLFFNCIPVYYGMPNKHPGINVEKYCIKINDINNVEETLDLINSLDINIYNEKIKDINSFKYKLFASSEYNIWKKIINIIQNH